MKKNSKEYSAGLRIYHWLNALTVLFILFTVFTRTNWLEKYKVRDMILNFADKNSINISPDLAYQMAKIIRNEIWNYHYYLGIFLAILLVYRFLLLLFPGGRKTFKTGFSIFKTQQEKKAGIKFLYIIIYITLTIAVTTGLLMYFKKELGVSEQFSEALEAIHMGIVRIIIYFVPIHLIGVILGELGNDKGIISKMINGGKNSN